MIKIIVTFISLFAICFFGIELFRQFTKQERWETVKTISYSLAISLFVICMMTLLVVLF